MWVCYRRESCSNDDRRVTHQAFLLCANYRTHLYILVNMRNVMIMVIYEAEKRENFIDRESISSHQFNKIGRRELDSLYNTQEH